MKTAIGAYDDYVYCAFDCYQSGDEYCRSTYSYTGGSSFFESVLSGDASDHTFSPDVTLAGGSGRAVVYCEDVFVEDRGRFFWQNYGGSTTLPEHSTFASGIRGSKKPDIEHLGGGRYGIVYIHYDYPIGGVYFQGAENCCLGIRGNINTDMNNQINIADLTFLVAYLFGGGAAPGCLKEASVNGDASVNIADLTYLVAYLFGGGPAPVNCP
jgi:hypothetical protein